MRMYRGDLKPDLVIYCSDGGVPVDLSTATSIKVNATRDGVSLFTARTAGVTDDGNGAVRMLWQAADTNAVGELVVEAEVTWPGSKPQTFRPDETVTVVADLG